MSRDVRRHIVRTVSAPLPSSRFAAIAYYGPDDTRASKVVVSIFPDDEGDAIAAHTWTANDSDVRHDPAARADILAFINRHGAFRTTTVDRIIGCPHEEGIDYPLGRVCPFCPFWAGIDRFTHEPLPKPRALMSPEQVIADLSRERATPPVAALESADAHRDVLVEPLLEVLDRVTRDPDDATDAELSLFSHALYIVAKWRDTRAYPAVLRWLAFGETADDLTGDVLPQDGARILAAVCDGNIDPILDLIRDDEAGDLGRDVAVDSLALLAVWAELPRQRIVDSLRWLIREGLPREPSGAWAGLSSACLTMAATELFDDIRDALSVGLIPAEFINDDDLDEVESDPEAAIDDTIEQRPPINDVGEAIGWWACFEHAGKTGRNDPCPCGSGKKSKKCCGA